MDNSSLGSSKSSDEELDLLFVEAAFPEQHQLGCLNIEDVGDVDCKEIVVHHHVPYLR